MRASHNHDVFLKPQVEQENYALNICTGSRIFRKYVTINSMQPIKPDLFSCILNLNLDKFTRNLIDDFLPLKTQSVL
ncbi:uncharacterized protein PHALS_15085 [Plasmopara halstedii]|uniref:Uncharacterized protein n=1 Tax=Plasmopara halstedii TaxID=4781 RepID=A0A0P1B1M8_PLAHL|nr:uncharacterized protein PHALS_15085 [Plasmopara halstedii]CEG47879.1 hypothetical protein PHALS_15085 [Plasmopara halstedii]|eukprot:XP_024584248.1 hypothetical protein PHALS_15085 [Plasmopara halstedii]